MDQERRKTTNMSEEKTQENSFHSKVAAVIEQVRPFLIQDGGDVELVGVEEETGVVKVRLQGACAHCPASTYTLHLAIEERLKEAVPEVKRVESVP